MTVTEPLTPGTEPLSPADPELLLEHWHHEGFARVVAHTHRFVDVVRSLDEEQLSAPVPGLDWRVRDVVSHVASVYYRYTVNRRRAEDRFGVAVHNAQDIVELGTDVETLSALMLEQITVLAMLVPDVPPSMEFEFHAGQPITMAGGWGNLLGELLAHGDDIAQATGVAWSMDGTDLEPLWRYAARVLPGWFSDEGRSNRATWLLDFGFATGPVRLRFTGGGLAIDEPDPRAPDHVVTADPIDATLAVPYRRRISFDPGLVALGSLFEVL